MNKYIYLAMIIGSSFVFSKEKESVKPNGCEGVVLCPSSSIYGRFNNDCNSRWSVNIGLLYQQPWMTDMGAGVADNGQNINNGEEPYANATSVFLEECFDYSLGLTAGIGYFMDHDNWFLSVDFDWLSSNIKNSYNNPGLIYHMMGFLNVDVSDFASLQQNTWDSMKTQANIDIYDLNFALNRGSFHSKCFSYETFAGVKALWYNQFYQRRGYSDTLPSSSSYMQGLLKSQSWGVGPSFGINGEYFLVKQLSIFSESSIAILYGGINTQTTSLYFDPSINNDINGVATYIQNFAQPYFIPFRTILGLKCGKYFLEDKHYIALKIGYDIRYVIGTAGLSGDVVQTSLTGQSFKVPIMLYKEYNIAANGLYLDFIWNF